MVRQPSRELCAGKPVDGVGAVHARQAHLAPQSATHVANQYQLPPDAGDGGQSRKNVGGQVCQVENGVQVQALRIEVGERGVCVQAGRGVGHGE